MTRYFITGATGFVGKHLLHALCGEDNRLLCLTRQDIPDSPKDKSILWVKGDLLDGDSYKGVLSETDCVIHLAGLISARRKEQYRKINVAGTESLLEACRDVGAPIKRFIHMSSIAAQGPNHDGNPLRETDVCSPQSEYGKSKYQAERVAGRYSQFFPVVILRPSFVYGPGDLRGLHFLKSLHCPATLFWASHIRTICLCHVKDVVQSCLLALEREIKSGDIFIISDPEVGTWASVGEILGEIFHDLLGLSPLYQSGHEHVLSGWLFHPPHYSPNEKRNQYWACDVSRAEKVLGFRPMVHLREGAYDTIRWYLKEGFFRDEDLKYLLEGLTRK